MRSHKYIFEFVYFALGIFAVFEGDSYFGILQGPVLGEIPEYFVYGAGSFAAAFGALLFLGLKRLKTPLKHGITLASFFLAAALPCAAWIIGTPSVFWASLILFCIIAGVNASMCAHYLHRIIRSGTRAGTLLAVATICGLVMTYLADVIFSTRIVPKAALLAICVFAMLFLALRKISLSELLDYTDSADSIGGDEGRRHFRLTLIMVAVAVAVMSYMIGVNDIAIFRSLQSGPDTQLFIPQAILYLPALFIAGVLADVKQGRYLPVATLACTLLTAPIVTLLASPEVFTLYSGVTYFLGGFYLIFIMFSLVSLAWRSRYPVFVTSLAAFLLFLFSGLGAVTSYIYIHADSAFSLTVYIGLVATMLVVFYLSGSLQPRAEKPAPEPPLVPDIPTLEELTESYGLTNRELEVLRLLLRAKNTADIAGEMTVTEKTVQNYVGSLLFKTDSKSRGEMIARFRRANL